jgi:hypothetical protein
MLPPFSGPIDLRFADTEYLGPANGACASGCWPAILHFNLLGILDLHFLSALHTVCLHISLLFQDSTRD